MTDPNVARGNLLAESLLRDRVLDALPLIVRRVWRTDAGDVSAGQPLTWTFIEFEAPAERASELADALAGVLDPHLGWYCSFKVGTEQYVVFAGRVFHYPLGDRDGRAEAEAYARDRGVPESQLDWE